MPTLVPSSVTAPLDDVTDPALDPGTPPILVATVSTRKAPPDVNETPLAPEKVETFTASALVSQAEPFADPDSRPDTSNENAVALEPISAPDLNESAAAVTDGDPLLAIPPLAFRETAPLASIASTVIERVDCAVTAPEVAAGSVPAMRSSSVRAAAPAMAMSPLAADRFVASRPGVWERVRNAGTVGSVVTVLK